MKTNVIYGHDQIVWVRRSILCGDKVQFHQALYHNTGGPFYLLNLQHVSSVQNFFGQISVPLGIIP
jgi:hypothetical protein